MKQAATSHKEEKVRSYIISFKLEVLDFAEKKSISAAALKFKLEGIQFVTERKNRTTYKKFPTLLVTKKRKRLQGGGRKIFSEEMDNQLLEWFFERRLKMLRVSIYGDSKLIDPDRYDENFQASNGCLFKFMKRHNLSLRRKTSATQKTLSLGNFHLHASC